MKTSAHLNRGFAVISVLFIIAAISLMLGMLIRLSGQRAFTARKLANQVKALAYAEAGIDYAYSILSLDFDQRNNTALSTETTYAEGSYALTLTPVSNKYVIVNSVGKCGDAVREAEILVDDENAGSGSVTDPTDYSSMEGFNYAVLSGGTLNFGGSGTVTGAKMHSNNRVDVRGSIDAQIDISSSVEIDTSKVVVDGSLTAPELDLHPKTDIYGTTTEATVPAVGIPDIDLTPYLSWAQKNGEVYNGLFSTSSSYTPAGGILWVNGDVEISSHAVINGSIIATGNIHISGGVDINPTTTTFAMASRDGNIYNTSSGTLNGLIYAKTGDYSQTANGTLNGQLLVNGATKLGGNSDVINYVRSVPTPPGLPGSVVPTTAWPVLSAWQK